MHDAPKDSQEHGLGRAIREHRRERGLSLAAVAERVGCARSYLSAIETGRRGAPSPGLVDRLEEALGLSAGELQSRAAWERTPAPVRADVARLRAARSAIDSASRRLAAILASGQLDQAHQTGELRQLVDRIQPEDARAPAADGVEPSTQDAPQHTGRKRNQAETHGAGTAAIAVALPMEVPLINKVAAGYPADFTDLGYPARMADEYVRVPDLADPDAFAARVIGDSMEPEYREGDIVVFSPARDLNNGCDCFARLEPDHESTFKRVYFEVGPGGEELIRLQPTNNSYAPRTVERERVAGLYRAVSVTRAL
ncbi:MAG: S24 family peptidase [Planctomycetota bacterium]